MTPGRAICVSRDRGLRGIVEPALASAGITVEHCDAVPGDTRGAVLVIVDRATRQAAGPGGLAAIAGLATPVVIVGDDPGDDELIAAMLDAPVSHVIADPRDPDLGITAAKLASGDLFGLEKYLARGAAACARTIASEVDKRHAIGCTAAWAEAIGARQPVVHRLAGVVDELVMNALYDTPAAAAPSAPSAVLRWAADDRMIAVSVGDSFGTLRQRDVIDHVRRARRERGRPLPERDAPRGAGIGLYLVLGNVASLVVNVEAGTRTEVVCLFDRTAPERPAAPCVRSLHVFQAAAR
ncbi:MAG TPA: hypothetical protein VGD37_04375 [Kofleriaceae bacterium]|jgi:hypothetical protein